jgi:hypothetical protein
MRRTAGALPIGRSLPQRSFVTLASALLLSPIRRSAKYPAKLVRYVGEDEKGVLPFLCFDRLWIHCLTSLAL